MKDFDFDSHFESIQNTHKRMLWMFPLMIMLNVVLGVSAFAVSVFIVLWLLRYFGVI